MKTNKRPIAMRCTQEQFDIIKNKDQVFWLTCVPEKYAEKLEDDN